MLVLSRKLGEEIFLDVPPSDRRRTITVTLADLDRGKVRIGITAARDVTVFRDNLLTGEQILAMRDRIEAQPLKETA